MSHAPFYDELVELMSELDIEVRLDTFEREQPNAGGYCLVKGKELVVLDAERSEGERSRVLIEVLEKLQQTKSNQAIEPKQLSPALLQKLIARGNAYWQPPSNCVTTSPSHAKSRPALRLVYDSSRD